MWTNIFRKKTVPLPIAVDSGAEVKRATTSGIFAFNGCKEVNLTESVLVDFYKQRNPKFNDFRQIQDFVVSLPSVEQTPQEIVDMVEICREEDPSVANCLAIVQTLAFQTRATGSPLTVPVIFVTMIGMEAEPTLVFYEAPHGINFVD